MHRNAHRHLALVLALLVSSAGHADPLAVQHLEWSNCFQANPDVFEVMTGWVSAAQDQRCLLALPNQGKVRNPMIEVEGERVRLIRIETRNLKPARRGGWEKRVRFKSPDGLVKVELRYWTDVELCKQMTETSCTPPKYGQILVEKGARRFAADVQQLN